MKLEKDANSANVNIGTWHLRKREYQADPDPFPGIKENEDAENKLAEFNSFINKVDSTDGRECKSLYAANNPLEQRREDKEGPRTDFSGLDFEMRQLVVKDICMDREISLLNKCSAEDCELDHGIITCLLNLDVDTDSNSTKDDCIKDAVQRLTGDVGEEKCHKVSMSEAISATTVAPCSNGHDNPSSSIMHSGPISQSGSISFRSNSSNTSTRSFAFPILSTEWNGSPVRMVESNGRHLKKHRRRGIGFLCCKF